MSTTLVVPDPAAEPEVGHILRDAPRVAGEVRIETTADAEEAAAELVRVRRALDRLEAVRVRLVRPLDHHIAGLNAAFRGLAAPLDQARTWLEAGIKDWRRRLREVELRMEAEARDLQERELARQRRAAERTGRIILPQPPPEIRSALPPALPTEEGEVRVRVNWRWELTDAEAVPRRYLVVNRSLVTHAVRSEGVREIPGIRIWAEEDLAVYRD